jgi:hypothetical protein
MISLRRGICGLSAVAHGWERRSDRRRAHTNVETVMNLDQARAIMDARFDPQNRPRYGDWVVAGQVIAQHYAKRPEKMGLVYTTDASGPMRDLPGRTLDQPRYAAPEKSRALLAEEARPLRFETWANVVTRDPSQGGPRLVTYLEGDLSNYVLQVDPATQRPALFYYPRGRIDPVAVGTSHGTVTRTMDHDRSYYLGMARQAAVQRELTGAVLKDINRRNREGWSGR